MAYPIKGNPEGCPFGVQDCVSCYWSKVKDGQWKGGQDCWNSNCIVLDKERWKKGKEE